MKTSPTLRPSAPPDPLAKATAETIRSIRRWSDKLLSFKVSRNQNFRFTPGQWVRLGIASGGKLGGVIWRPYSMVNATYDEELEFFSIIMPGGAFTSRLAEARVGDTIFVEKQPFGFLTTSRFTNGRDLWLLASGTGVAPYLSILRDPTVWTQYENRVLAYSVRQAQDLAYLPEILSLADDELFGAGVAPFRLVPIVTREQHPGALQARLPELITNGNLERAAGLSLHVEHSRLLVCGNPQMLDDVRDALVARGLHSDRSSAPGQFATENYW